MITKSRYVVCGEMIVIPAEVEIGSVVTHILSFVLLLQTLEKIPIRIPRCSASIPHYHGIVIPV